MKEKIVILTGPTGVGKTKLSIELAQKINGEIISCDAYQIYKRMDIGTDKIRVSEMNEIVHHNIDIVNPDENFNTAMFKTRTEKLISEIYSREKRPILVGGTGLYLHSLIYEMNFGEVESDAITRSSIEKIVEEKGLAHIYIILKNIDENISEYVDENNTHRVIRAYEIYLKTNNKPSTYLSKFRKKNKKYDFLYFVLNNKREVLYENIDSRVEQMMNDGLLNEINGLLEAGYHFDMQSLKGIGYKEFKPYFEGEIPLKDAVEKVKQHSRNFAKRQITWFKKEDKAIWINKNEFKIEQEILEYLVKLAEEFFKDEFKI